MPPRQGQKTQDTVPPLRLTWALGALLLSSLTLTCADRSPSLSLSAPPRLRQAVLDVDGLQLFAQAQLHPQGGSALAPQDLSRADDGVSFSGFIPAAPGEYSLDIVFFGQGGPLLEKHFLGRLRSDGLTVSQGHHSQAQFSQALDALGDAEDGGDSDGDGLATLDELLIGSALDDADSDDDNVDDGLDCDPNDPGRSYTILPGGDHRDCDGDGYQRVDVSFGPRGEDCDDKDPSVNPSAVDDCGDSIDQDCNPSTCASDSSDRSPPVIHNVWPVADSEIGCHQRFAAEVSDDSNVANVTLSLPNCAGIASPLYFAPDPAAGANHYLSPVLNQLAGSTGLDGPGCDLFEFDASDANLNYSTLRRVFVLAFSVPQVLSMTPAQIAEDSRQFQVDIEASADFGVQRVELWLAAKNGANFDLANAEQLGLVESNAAQFAVDLQDYSDGEYLLYPVVWDQRDNALQPSSGDLNAGHLTGDHRCLDSMSPGEIPARVVLLGETGQGPTKMRAHLDQAISLAQGVDSAAVLVAIKGMGLQADGNIDLSDSLSYSKRWEYSFYNAAIPPSGRWLTVTWLSAAYLNDNPVITENAGNVIETVPLTQIPALIDSDRAAAAFTADGCVPLGGYDSDFISYTQDQDSAQPVILISTADSSYKAAAIEPVTLIYGCQ